MGASIPESYYKYLGSLPCKQPVLMAARYEVEKQLNKRVWMGARQGIRGTVAESHFTAGNSKGKVLVVVGRAESRHRNKYLPLVVYYASKGEQIRFLDVAKLTTQLWHVTSAHTLTLLQIRTTWEMSKGCPRAILPAEGLGAGSWFCLF